MPVIGVAARVAQHVFAGCPIRARQRVVAAAAHRVVGFDADCRHGVARYESAETGFLPNLSLVDR